MVGLRNSQEISQVLGFPLYPLKDKPPKVTHNLAYHLITKSKNTEESLAHYKKAKISINQDLRHIYRAKNTKGHDMDQMQEHKIPRIKIILISQYYEAKFQQPSIKLDTLVRAIE